MYARFPRANDIRGELACVLNAQNLPSTARASLSCLSAPSSTLVLRRTMQEEKRGSDGTDVAFVFAELLITCMTLANLLLRPGLVKIPLS